MKRQNIILVSIALLIACMNISYAQVGIRTDLGVVGYKTTDTTVLDKRLKWSFWDLLAGFVPIVGDFAGGGIRSHYDRKKY